MRFLIALALLALSGGVIVSFLDFGGDLLRAGGVVIPFAAGILIGIFVDQVILRRAPAIETFEHELTHALCAMLFLRRLESFVVRRGGGGAVRHRGNFGGTFGDDFIGLAPYFLPTFTVATVLVRPVLGSQWFPWYDVAIGTTFGFHLWTTARETQGNWTGRIFPDAISGQPTRSDIAERGFVYSFLFITVSSLAVMGFLAAVLVHGYHGIPDWARVVWDTTAHLAGRAAAWARS